MADEYKTVDERQRYVQKSGQEWEKFVNKALKKLDSNHGRMNIGKVYHYAA
ncbi:TPA: hypothetical protein H1009_02525 [archaeon]|nr:hypothetical protein [Candidatus Naiadarchaeales archaeon SRR2090153.bin461]